MLPPFGPDDLARLRWATRAIPSTGGEVVAVSTVEPDPDRDVRHERWRILRRDGGEVACLPDGSRLLRWAPDGRRLRWIVPRGDGSALVELDRADPGTVRDVLGPVGTYVREMAFDPNDMRVALAGTVVRPPRFDPRLPPEPATARPPVVIDHAVFRDVDGDLLPPTSWELAVGTLGDGSLRRYPLPEGVWADATEEGEGFEPDWFPDGSALVVSLSPGWDEAFELPDRHRALFRLDLATGGFERLTDDAHVCRAPRVSPDGSAVAFLRQRGDPGDVVSLDEVCVLDLETREVRSLSEEHDLSFSSLAWFPDRRALCVGLVERGRVRLACLGLDGSLRPIADDCGPAFDMAADGRIAAVTSDPTIPGDPIEVGPERPTAEGAREGIRLATLNPWLRDRRLAETSEMTYRSAHPDAREIHAMVAVPPGTRDLARLPVVVDLHGGPYASRGWWFDAARECFAGQGFVVIQPNYRGSDGFGQDFTQLSDRRHYPGWFDDPSAPHEMGLDVVGALDAIRERGLGDPDRVFLRGVSAGAILTTWVLGRTDRFVAAAANSWYPGEWGAPMYGWYQLRRYFAGPPWDPDHTPAYWRRSPIMLVDRMTTPLLLVHGERDWFTPQLETEKLYHALRGAGLDVALATFPDETHGIRRHPAGARNALLTEVAWFRRHDRERTPHP